MIYKLELCHECGNVVASNWHVRHLKSGCKVGSKTHEELNLMCDIDVCNEKAVYGGKVLGTSGLVCELHKSEVREPEPLFSE